MPYLCSLVMKLRHSILFLLLCLFLGLSTSSVLACGDMDADHVSRFHHEHDSSSHQHGIVQSHDHHAHSDDGCDTDQEGQTCPDDESGHCHCPGCGAVCHITVLFSAADAIFTPLLFDASMQRDAFYFAEHLPEAVYLPIWQPPKWVARCRVCLTCAFSIAIIRICMLFTRHKFVI